MNIDFDSNVVMLIIVIVNVFVMGILVVVAIRSAIAHHRSKSSKGIVDKPHPKPNVISVHLPEKVRDKMLESSEAHFQMVLNRSATTLERDLKSITDRLTKQLDKVGSEIILTEMKRYRSDLEAMRKQAETIIEEAQRDVVEHQGTLKSEFAKKQADLEAKLKQEIDDEKQAISKRINDNLSDAIAAFLSEAMKHEIDLGAQTGYLTKVLDEHKAELIKEIMDETV